MDPILDFNKRLNMKCLSKKYWKHFQKSMILKAWEKRNHEPFLWVTLFVENLREGKKQYFSKRKDLII